MEKKFSNLKAVTLYATGRYLGITTCSTRWLGLTLFLSMFTKLDTNLLYSHLCSLDSNSLLISPFFQRNSSKNIGTVCCDFFRKIELVSWKREQFHFFRFLCFFVVGDNVMYWEEEKNIPFFNSPIQLWEKKFRRND